MARAAGGNPKGMQHGLLPEPAPLVPRRVRIMALATALVVGGIHLGLSDQRYKQAPYVGALFAAGALGLIVMAAIAASSKPRWGRPVVWTAWGVGAVICAAMFIGFLLARTVGLPGWHPSSWPPVQLVALAFELGYLVAFAAAVRARRRDEDRPGGRS